MSCGNEFKQAYSPQWFILGKKKGRGEEKTIIEGQSLGNISHKSDKPEALMNVG